MLDRLEEFDEFMANKIDAAELERRKAEALEAAEGEREPLSALDAAYKEYESMVRKRVKVEKQQAEAVRKAHKMEDEAELKVQSAANALLDGAVGWVEE